MRGSVYFVLSCALAGCWHGHRDDSDACAVVLVRPGNVNEEVAIRPTLRLEWNTSVDVADARVTLRSIDGQDVPVTLLRESDRVASVTTDHSLRFDTVYTVEVSPVSARDLDEGTCVGATTAFHTLLPKEVEQPLRMASLEALVQVDHYLVGSSRAYRGLQVFDIEQPDAPALVATLPTDVHAAGISVLGTRAYIPAELDGVLIADLSEPTAPALLGRIGTPGMVRAVAPFDRNGTSYVAIADGVEGVRIVDVSDPVAPRSVAVFDPSGARAADVRALDIEGNRLAVADGEHGYFVLDLTSPSNPMRIASGYADRAAIDVAIDRDLLYVSHFPAFIDVFDLRLAGAPRVGGVRPCDVCMQRYPVYLHEANGQLHVSAAREGVRTYALDGAGGMTLTGLRQTPGPAFAVVETAARVYVGEEGGLVGFDRSIFRAPRYIEPTGHGSAGAVASIDGLAYVAASSRGLQVFDLENPEHPKLVAAIPTPASPSGDISAAFVTATSDLLLVGDVRGGLVTFDRASAPTAPTTMGQVQATDGVTKMISVSLGVVLACQGNTGLFLADVSNPAAPRVLVEAFFRDISPPQGDYCNDVDFDESTRIAYVAGNAGITVVEVGELDAIAPLRIVGRFAVPSGDAVASVARRGRTLYATTRLVDFEGRHGVTTRLQVFDLADPRVPTWRSTSNDLGEIGGLTLVDDKAFVAARDLGVYVFDLSTPEEPSLELLIPTRGDAVSFDATAETLYVAESTGGLGVIHTGPLPVDRD
jgi:hypothetical protein